MEYSSSDIETTHLSLWTGNKLKKLVANSDKFNARTDQMPIKLNEG